MLFDLLNIAKGIEEARGQGWTDARIKAAVIALKEAGKITPFDTDYILSHLNSGVNQHV